MTQLFYAHIYEKNHNRLLQEFLPSFPEYFQYKILKFNRWEDAQLSLIGRLLLKYGLKRIDKDYHKEKIGFTQYYKPYFLDSNIRFNISHSGNIVVCAISNSNDVGIDIELIGDINVRDFKSQMTANEWRYIMNSSDTKVAFFKYWTQKEAVVKANGMALSISLKSFEVINNYTTINKEKYFVKEIDLDKKYKCHLAFKNKLDSINPDAFRLSF